MRGTAADTDRACGLGGVSPVLEVAALSMPWILVQSCNDGVQASVRCSEAEREREQREHQHGISACSKKHIEDSISMQQLRGRVMQVRFVSTIIPVACDYSLTLASHLCSLQARSINQSVNQSTRGYRWRRVRQTAQDSRSRAVNRQGITVSRLCMR